MYELNGHIISSSERVEKGNLQFSAGDVVTVQFDPSTGKLTYSKDGTHKAQIKTSVNGFGS